MDSRILEYEVQTVTYFYADILYTISSRNHHSVRDRQRIINVTKIAEKYCQVNCAALLGIHVFTSCDSTSASKGRGKVKGIRPL